MDTQQMEEQFNRIAEEYDVNRRKFIPRFDEYYEKGYIDKVVTTNLNYRTPELLSRPYYVEATMTKFLAAIIDCINHDVSTEHVNDPTERIHTLLAKYENLENKEK